MDFLTNHLSSEDNGYLRQARDPGPHRGLPPGVAATDRAVDTTQASPEPLRGSRLGAPAGLPTHVPQGADAVESCVDPSFACAWQSLPPQLHTSESNRGCSVGTTSRVLICPCCPPCTGHRSVVPSSCFTGGRSFNIGLGPRPTDPQRMQGQSCQQARLSS
jgi:hypothetical protein